MVILSFWSCALTDLWHEAVMQCCVCIKLQTPTKLRLAAVDVSNTFTFFTSIDRIYRNIASCLVQKTVEVVQKVIKGVIGKEEVGNKWYRWWEEEVIDTHFLSRENRIINVTSFFSAVANIITVEEKTVFKNQPVFKFLTF